MKSPLFLAQSDTTVGFLCQDAHKINQAKQRENQKILIEVCSLATLLDFVRVPQKHKNAVRRSQKTTFIFPNKKAIRLIGDSLHLQFLQNLKWAYSSSANLTGCRYDIDFATQKADIIIQDSRGLFEGKPSKIIQINTQTQKRIR